MNGHLVFPTLEDCDAFDAAASAFLGINRPAKFISDMTAADPRYAHQICPCRG